ELVARAEAGPAEDLLAAALVVGVAQLARLAHRLLAGVDADVLALPLADDLVTGNALVVGEVARADVAVLAMVLVVNRGVRLRQRPGARREKIGPRRPRPEKKNH